MRYVSASPLTATVNALTGLVKIIGPGNAVMLANDAVASSDSLVQGGATVSVNQVTAGVGNTPKTVDLGVGGQAQIIAHALDRNGFVIPGKTFSWSSADTRVVTVDGAGIVIGVGIGITDVVGSADGYAASTRVAVTAQPPKQILWGFDSAAVGKGGATVVGLLVTAPAGPEPLTIQIESSDPAIATATPDVVTIPIGSSATSTVIEGLSPGRAILTAKDAGGSGYSEASMIVDVGSPGAPQQLTLCCAELHLSLTKPVMAYVSIPVPAPAPITVTLSALGVSVPATVTIDKSTTSASFPVIGLLPGLGVLNASAPGYVDAATIQIPVLSLPLGLHAESLHQAP
jgi:hypothetical protein